MLTRTSALFTLESEISLSSFLSYANMFIRSSSNQSSFTTKLHRREIQEFIQNDSLLATVSSLMKCHCDDSRWWRWPRGGTSILFISQKFSFEITISHVRKENNKDDCWLSRGESSQLLEENPFILDHVLRECSSFYQHQTTVRNVVGYKCY